MSKHVHLSTFTELFINLSEVTVRLVLNFKVVNLIRLF